MSQVVPASVHQVEEGMALSPSVPRARTRAFEAAIPSDEVSYPAYDRNALGCGIAHIGVGNFHRSHQALHIHEYLQKHPGNWMVHGVACLPEDLPLVQAMKAQGCLYTLTERTGQKETIRVVGSMKQVTHAPSEPGQVERLLVSEQIKIISLTITEAGYPCDALGDLNVNDSAIRSDLRGEQVPLSAFGHIYLAAHNRMRMGGQPFTVLSCDDIPENGNLTKRLLLQFAELKDPEVADWIRDNVTFPNSMIDRIAPAMSPQTRGRLRYGIEDKCSVLSESNPQWIIEDRFINDRPLLATVGVRFTDHIAPYESVKLRLVEGSKVALAHVARMLDYRYVAQAMKDPLVVRFVEGYLDEAARGLQVPHGLDVAGYKAGIVARLSNDSLRNQTSRLAADASRKMTTSLVPVVESRLQDDTPFDFAAFAIAVWCRYLRGVDEHGSAIDVIDVLSVRLAGRVNISPKDPVHFLSMPEVFGKRLPMEGAFIGAVANNLDVIDRLGVRNALAHLLGR